MPYGLKLPTAFNEYENGKHRRYGLLFSVNGGAFAVAKLLSNPSEKLVLGGLTLQNLSAGMILFTVVMIIDIYLFGMNLRHTLTHDPAGSKLDTTELFAWQGRVVLIAIGVLICAGWVLAAR